MSSPLQRKAFKKKKTKKTKNGANMQGGWCCLEILHFRPLTKYTGEHGRLEHTTGHLVWL